MLFLVNSPSKSLEISESTSNSPSAISVSYSSARRSLELAGQAPPHCTETHRQPPPTHGPPIYDYYAALKCSSDTPASVTDVRKVKSSLAIWDFSSGFFLHSKLFCRKFLTWCSLTGSCGLSTAPHRYSWQTELAQTKTLGFLFPN